MDFMQARIKAIREGMAGEMIWLVEYPPIYTAGTSAQQSDLLDPQDKQVRYVGRGGEWTYHGPGQRLVSIILDLTKRGQDVRQFVRNVESFAINTLRRLNIDADRRNGYPGVWMPGESTENNIAPPNKITAIGVRLTKWVTWHGMAINVDPDLSGFDGIVPCGIHDGGVTKISHHRPHVTMADVDAALYESFAESFPF